MSTRRQPRRKPSPFGRAAFAVLVLAAILFGIYDLSHRNATNVLAQADTPTISPVASTGMTDTVSPADPPAPAATVTSSTTNPNAKIPPLDGSSPIAALDANANLPLADQVHAVIDQVQGTFGIAVKDEDTDETFFFNPDTSFTMASTYKTPLVIAAMAEVEKGNLSDDTMIGAYSLDQSDNMIITQSNEDSAELLAQTLGWPKVQSYAQKLGMDNTDYTGQFTTTPRDQLALYENIYKGNGISKNVQSQITALLKAQQVNDRIPAYLPNNVVVYHKTGDLDYIRHDVGYVTAGNTTFVIALMSKDLGMPSEGLEAEAQLSYVFYKYFTKNS